MTFTPRIEKMSSAGFAQFSDKLFLCAHVWMLLISACGSHVRGGYNQIGIISEFTERIAWSGCLEITGINNICCRSNAGALYDTCCDVQKCRFSATVNGAVRVAIEKVNHPIICIVCDVQNSHLLH